MFQLRLVLVGFLILAVSACGSGGGNPASSSGTENLNTPSNGASGGEDSGSDNTSSQSGDGDVSDTEEVNAKPISVITGDINAKPGQLVEFSGTGSSDTDGDPLTYSWSLAYSPPGSKASLSEPSLSGVSFTPDVDGLYKIQLIVNDGKVDSLPTTIDLIVSTPNVAPIANAGTDQSVDIGMTVMLDGSASSDPDGDPLKYQWSFISKPIDSQAELLNANSINPTFVPDQHTLTRSYKVQLIVSDGNIESAPDTVVINVPLSGVPPATPQGVHLDTGVETTQEGTAESWVLATWNANTESDLREYEVNFKKAGQDYYFYYPKTTGIKFQPVDPGETYYFRVRAVDKQGNPSEWTAEQSIVAAKDMESPAVPTGLVLSTGLALDNNGVTYDYLSATWAASTETDVTSYKLRIKEGVDGPYFYATSTTDELTFVNVKQGTSYYVGVEAVDSSGNESEYTVDRPIVSATDTTFSGSPIVTAFEIPGGENALYLLTSNFGGSNEYATLSIADFTYQGDSLSKFYLSGTAASTGDVFSTGNKSIIFTTTDSIGFGPGGITFTGRLSSSGYTTINGETFGIGIVASFENSSSSYIRFKAEGSGIYRIEIDVYDSLGGTDGIDPAQDFDDLVFLIGPRTRLEAFLGHALQ